MGVCCLIIVIIFVVNIIRQVNSGSKDGMAEIKIEENEVNRAEAYRLLSYFQYDKGQREALTKGILYEKETMSGWYDTFVNAAWKMGLIDQKVEILPTNPLTYGHCKELIDQLILDHTELQTVYDDISFDFQKSEDNMKLDEFIELYMTLLPMVEDRFNIEEKTMFLLNQELSEDGRDRMVTDQGLFYYGYAKDYQSYFEEAEEVKGAGEAKEAEEAKKAEEAKEAEKTDQEQSNQNGEDRSITADQIHNKYINHNIHVLMKGQEILFIKDINTDQLVLRNIWIEEGLQSDVKTYISGHHKTLQTKFPLSKEVSKVVGDITIQDQKIIQISVKPDTIQGKVLQTGKGYIEIEGYGQVPLDEDYRIYKIYGEMSMEQTSSILVGYSNTDFVVSGGKISAAIIKENIDAENIRVLIKTTDHKDIYHDEIKLTATSHFVVRGKETEATYKAGEVVTFQTGDESLTSGRIEVKPILEEGRIEVLSVERSGGNPIYRGAIEVAQGEQGLLLINDLSLEEYLYAVIPSEMPTYYGLEALKVQAICARSYAYKHLMANSLNELGAHVDDSVSYQVYNNIPENEDTILAVKDTYGKVIKYNDEVITAYYFSTSSGHTTGSEDVWSGGETTPYLKGKLLTVQETAEVAGQQEKEIYRNLAEEDNFRKFIMDYDYRTYDTAFNWYRWNVNIDHKELKERINSQLKARYQVNPNLILTKVEGEDTFESMEVDSVGDIVDISVKKRATGGIITELLITGSKNTVLVKTEYNIRTLLAPVNDVVTRIDDSKVENLSLLPSAYFMIESEKGGKHLESITLYGGGYGHGVGMSQNGVKAMTEVGMKYEDITAYFYDGSEIGFIYN